MDLSVKLLNNYVDISDQDIGELAEKITRIGHEVEGIRPLARGTDLVIGYVAECFSHPDSDHLKVCKVEVEPGLSQQIVCGAPNVAAGQKVIVAKVGCDLGDGFIIKKTVIRGQESNGMICSLAELGIDSRFLTEEQKSGIEVLAADAPLGEPALAYLGLEDCILEVGLTPNRADCMAVKAFAYEVGAILKRAVSLPEIKKYSENKSDIKVKIESELCPFFGVKLVKGLTTKESPQWLKSYLMASGIKPINNIVDISNFVMVETGQPIHMYDYDKLKDKTFTIKTGLELKEKMLDGQEYEIKANDLIVSTDGGVGCIAGIMGSDSTKVDENTTNIVIEAATFDGPTIRETARRLNLLTDASGHFIKGSIDTQSSLEVLDRCADLLMQLADGQEVYESVTSDLIKEERRVTISRAKINGLLGTNINIQEIGDIFKALRFDYKQEQDSFVVKVPSYRNDISLDADLVEEVARMYGYDKIPSTLPEMAMTIGKRTPMQSQKKMIKELLIDQGLQETITYTLTAPTSANDFNLFHQGKDVNLAFPLGEERSTTRKSVIPSLLQVINYNNSYNIKDVNIFEITTTYDSDEEITSLGIACSGLYQELSFMNKVYEADFYLVKGFVETVLRRLGINESRYWFERVDSTDLNYHPGQAAKIVVNKKTVGVVGKIHPLMAKKYDVKDVFVAQLNLSALLNIPTGQIKYTAIPQYPAVTRDIALVMDKDIVTYHLVRKIIQTSKQLVKEAKIFDIYEGEHIAPGKKSVAIKLTFQDLNKTLDEKTVNDSLEKILSVLEKDFQVVLRT